MTDDLTGNLDLLGDWLDAKGYGEEAGLCTRVMDHMHKQDALIVDWEFRHGNLSRHIDVLVDLIERQAARIAALEDVLKPFADDAKEYWSDTEETPDGAAVGVDVAWLRAARAAMEGKDG